MITPLTPHIEMAPFKPLLPAMPRFEYNIYGFSLIEVSHLMFAVDIFHLIQLIPVNI